MSNLPERNSRLSDQTKITRALAFGMIPQAHPDELKVLHFLAQQPPPKNEWSGYRWRTGGGRFQSQTQWALMLGMNRRQLWEALQRLAEFNLIYQTEPRHGPRGSVEVEHALTPAFVAAAVEWHDVIWLGTRLSERVYEGEDPVEAYEKTFGLDNKFTRKSYPPRPSRKRDRPRLRRVSEADY